MNKETGQDKKSSGRVEGIKAVVKKPYSTPSITFIEDIEVVAADCTNGGKSNGTGGCASFGTS